MNLVSIPSCAYYVESNMTTRPDSTPGPPVFLGPSSIIVYVQSSLSWLVRLGNGSDVENLSARERRRVSRKHEKTADGDLMKQCHHNDSALEREGNVPEYCLPREQPNLCYCQGLRCC